MDAARAPQHAAPGPSGAPAGATSAANTPDASPPERSWLSVGARCWLLAYLLGLIYALCQLVHARRMLLGLAAAGSRLITLSEHAGFAMPQTCARTPLVIEVDAPISPMLFGLFTPRLLLPRHLRAFSPIAQQMIVEHELTHLRRRDLQWMSAGVLLQTVLWFNPLMRLLRADLAWAQELGCDRDVLRERSAEQRKAYAAALITQLRVQHRPLRTALAFGAVNASTLATRIALIRQCAAAPAQPWTRRAALCGLAGIVAGSLAFQPALALRSAPLAPAQHGAPDNPRAAPHNATGSLAEGASLAPFGCTEMVDAASGRRLVHEGQCDERVTPASTFNIAVSLMGYDSGILRDEHTPRLPFRPGYADWNRSWRAPTDPASWIKNSVLWYAQQVVAQLGAARFQRYITGFDYGNADLSGDAGEDNGLTLSWVSSSLQISPVEQVAFLRKVVNRTLPLSATAYDMTLRILPAETLANGWEVHGKTGTAMPVLADGTDDKNHQYGWFVGWASKQQRTIVFARLVRDQRRQADSAGPRLKQAFLSELPARLDAL